MVNGGLADCGAVEAQYPERFANCPYTHPTATQCVDSATASGEFAIGKSTVPITRTVTVKRGLTPPVLVPAANGETLAKTARQLPGGLISIELLGNFTEVTATAELAGTRSIGSTVSLPLEGKLDNLALGSNCYIGSEAERVALNRVYATTSPPRPNKPINGKAKKATQTKRKAHKKTNGMHK